MATLVLTAVGTALGGPLGGALGALAGRSLDGAIFGSGNASGPRLSDLAVTTSSYGSAIPRLFGRMRVPGTIIWATDLLESSETSGGKGRPSVTTYSYSASFAVALSSRPIIRLGRIWADGNLLRGAAGDLKVNGILRVYEGHGDQPVDPLIQSDKGAGAPAFRNTAYAIFEGLDLSEFGNRIPSLTFEVIADEDNVSLGQLIEPSGFAADITRDLAGLAGYCDDGGSLQSHLSLLEQLFPFSINHDGALLAISVAEDPASIASLPSETAVADEDEYAFPGGRTRIRGSELTQVPNAIRYYDMGRDYQIGMQRSGGRARSGAGSTIEFPGALQAKDALMLVNGVARRTEGARDRMSWRMAELDPVLTPGKLVTIPAENGVWRIESWEWREKGVELELARVPMFGFASVTADAGESLRQPDLIVGASLIQAFELPWSGSTDADQTVIHTAVSSASGGWKGAALYGETDGSLIYLGASSTRRAIIGVTSSALPPSSALLIDRDAALDVTLATSDFALEPASIEMVANGANLARIGEELVQFLNAERIGEQSWRISGILRGRGGTEGAALEGAVAGVEFTLIDNRLTPLTLTSEQTGFDHIVALGAGDETPVSTEIASRGRSLRPFAPVQARHKEQADGGLLLQWFRRARGSWQWSGETDVPLVESSERYLIGIGPLDHPTIHWETNAAELLLGGDVYSSLKASQPGMAIWVRQIGDHALSAPLYLYRIPTE